MSNMPTALVISSSKSILVEELLDQLKEKQCSVIFLSSPAELKKYFDADLFPSYLFLIDEFNISREILDIISQKKVKTQVVLPYIVDAKNRGMIEKMASEVRGMNNENLYIVYLGLVFGEGSVLPFGMPTTDFDTYVVYVKTCVNLLLKEMFSYGFPKKEVVIAHKMGAIELAKEIGRVNKVDLVPDSSSRQLSTVSNFDFISVRFNKEDLKGVFLETTGIKEVKKAREIKEIKIPFQKAVPIRKKRRRPYFVKKFLGEMKVLGVLAVVAFWILGLPLLSFLTASLSVQSGFKAMQNYQLGRSEVFFKFGKFTSGFSKSMFVFWNDGRRMANLVYDYADFGIAADDLIRKFSNTDLLNQNYLAIDDLYKKISLIAADTKDVTQSNFLPKGIDLEKTLLLSQNGKEIARNLPFIFGSEKTMKYLLLVQDSDEIRATGGKIKSYGVWTFDKGKLVKKDFNEVGVLDRQFKGHIDPPFPLAKYLNVDNWVFSDSNWESDFSEFSKRAEWFLKDVANIEVDGVIAFDKNAWNRILSFRDSFVMHTGEIIGMLDRKEIQVFSNRENVENSIRNLKWDGGIDFPKCSSGCMGIPVALIESNLGGKANKIIRNANFDISVEGNIIRNKLSIGFRNQSTDIYKNFLRLDVLKNSNFKMINGLTVNSGEFYDEAQLYIEILPGQVRQLTFEWTDDRNAKLDRLLVYFRKQPGVEMPLSLTVQGVGSYNTDLKEDFIKEINFL